MKRFTTLAASVVSSILISAPAFAAITFPQNATADLAPVQTWLEIAVVAYLALFGFRKLVKVANRS